MINKWQNLTPEERMKEILLEMKNKYYKTRMIDSIPHAIKVEEMVTDKVMNEDFFRIAIHSKIFTKYLEDDMPIVWMDMTGANIARGEEKSLVYRVTKEIEPIEIDEKPIREIIRDAYDIIGDIKAVFIPSRYLSQIHTDFEFDIQSPRLDSVSDGIYQFKVIRSTISSDWDEIVVLGQGALEWTRKITKTLPPNVSNYKLFSENKEQLQMAYHMNPDICHFMIGTVSRCRILDSEKIVTFRTPREISEEEIRIVEGEQ